MPSKLGEGQAGGPGGGPGGRDWCIHEAGVVPPVAVGELGRATRLVHLVGRAGEHCAQGEATAEAKGICSEQTPRPCPQARAEGRTLACSRKLAPRPHPQPCTPGPGHPMGVLLPSLLELSTLGPAASLPLHLPPTSPLSSPAPRKPCSYWPAWRVCALAACRLLPLARTGWALTARVVGVASPVDAHATGGTEGRVQLQARAHHVGDGHVTVVEDAALVERQRGDLRMARLEDPTASSGGLGGSLGSARGLHAPSRTAHRSTWSQTHSQPEGADPLSHPGTQGPSSEPRLSTALLLRRPAPSGAATGPRFLPTLRVRLGGCPPWALPKSHLLKISWQIDDEEHGVGEGAGLAAVGVGEGPRHGGWCGVVTFQWPDISEQEAATAPPGRRHSSFLSLVQVPRVGGAGGGPSGDSRAGSLNWEWGPDAQGSTRRVGCGT